MLYNLLQPARKKRFKTVFPEQQGIFSEAALSPPINASFYS